MNKDEFSEMAALVVRMRDVTAGVEEVNDELTKALAANVDALVKSNAQCGEYLRQNEQLHAAKDEMQNALAEATKDLAYSRLAVDTMCARDKRFTSTAALCGAGTNEDVGDFIERTAAERGKLHSELVDVRAALAATTEQRDSLQRTLDEWSNADTEPHDRVTAEDVADHVVPPVCFDCGSRLVEVGGLVFLCRSADCMKRLPTGAP